MGSAGVRPVTGSGIGQNLSGTDFDYGTCCGTPPVI